MAETVHIDDDGTPRELDDAELPAQGDDEDDDEDEGEGESWQPTAEKLTKSLESQAAAIAELKAKQVETDKMLNELQSKPEDSPPEPTPHPPEPEPKPKPNEPANPEPDTKPKSEPEPTPQPPAPAQVVRRRRAI
jgi:hypothetical protein